MTLVTIQNNFLKNITSKKVVNNALIGVNCTAIALKYVNYDHYTVKMLPVQGSNHKS